VLTVGPLQFGMSCTPGTSGGVAYTIYESVTEAPLELMIGNHLSTALATGTEIVKDEVESGKASEGAANGIMMRVPGSAPLYLYLEGGASAESETNSSGGIATESSPGCYLSGYEL
jgi:hypothetical protein